MRKVKSVGAALASTNRPMKQFVAADNLENVVAGMGTARDKRAFTRWGLPRLLGRDELENMWQTSWLCKRIVGNIADDMTREWRSITMNDADDNPQIDAIIKAENDLNVRGKFCDAITWARLYGGAVIVLGTDDVTNPADFLTPLDPTKLGKGCLRYLHVVDRWRIVPSGQIETDPMDPNFGMPSTYILAESSVEIHHTRLLRFNGHKLPYFSWRRNGMWDDSVLRVVFDSVVNYDTCSSAIATMMYEANVDVVKSPTITQLLSTPKGEEKIIKRLQASAMLKSFNRMLLLDGDEEYEKKSNSFANLQEIWEQFGVDVCGAAEQPMTILFGQSAAGMNATGDEDTRHYYDSVGAKQKTGDLKLRLDQFDQVFIRHVLGTYPEDFTYEFNNLWQMDDTEQSTIDYQNAQRDQIYLGAGVISEGLVASQLKLKGTYQSMSDEDVELAKELGTAMDPEPDPVVVVSGGPGQNNPNNVKTAPAKQTPKGKGKPK